MRSAVLAYIDRIGTAAVQVLAQRHPVLLVALICLSIEVEDVILRRHSSSPLRAARCVEIRPEKLGEHRSVARLFASNPVIVWPIRHADVPSHENGDPTGGKQTNPTCPGWHTGRSSRPLTAKLTVHRFRSPVGERFPAPVGLDAGRLVTPSDRPCHQHRQSQIDRPPAFSCGRARYATLGLSMGICACRAITPDAICLCAWDNARRWCKLGFGPLCGSFQDPWWRFAAIHTEAVARCRTPRRSRRQARPRAPVLRAPERPSRPYAGGGRGAQRPGADRHGQPTRKSGR